MSIPAHELCQKWILAFNERRLEDLLDLYTPQAEHFSPKLKARRPETQGLVVGRAAMKDWWQDCFDRLPHLKYEFVRVVSENEVAFLEYERHCPGEDSFTVAEQFFVSEGKIFRSRVFHG